MLKLTFSRETEVPSNVFKKATADGDGFAVDVAQLSPSEMASVVGYDPNPNIDDIPQDLGH